MLSALRHFQRLQPSDTQWNRFFSASFYLSVILIFSGALHATPLRAASSEADDKVIFFHRINYVLPFYRSSNLNNTALPEGLMGSVKNQEFKGQLSIKAPLFRDILSEHLHFYIAYTQLSYWQIYVSSPYFRDTNYQPEVFFDYRPWAHWQFFLGFDHESNGRGNHLERSWNRGFFQAAYKRGPWTLKFKPWVTLFDSSSIDVHNPDIVHYLGRTKSSVGYQWSRLSMFVEVTNLESGLKQGHQLLHVNVKLKPYLYLYVQGFNGYGQSLIDYNRRSTGIGVGFSFNSGLDA